MMIATARSIARATLPAAWRPDSLTRYLMEFDLAGDYLDYEPVAHRMTVLLRVFRPGRH
ncbi:hypothetical protein [Bradyrhizobium sp. UNPF46]|uniref:hypothetical protein n=1 Tax=Bradyrhizobium sp. UNPF46 TaxID=1141168 RepID=UPI0015F04470|nr:hypothetical protein [Bradyrhizobium sp. UNPF46]